MVKKYLTVPNLLLSFILLNGSLGLYEKRHPSTEVSDAKTIISIAIDYLKRKQKSKRR